MKAVEKIVAEDSKETLRRCVVELELENSKLKATVAETSEDYEVLQLGYASFLDERNDICYRCEDLVAELKRAHSVSCCKYCCLRGQSQVCRSPQWR
jgi:hypothetical protein